MNATSKSNKSSTASFHFQDSDDPDSFNGSVAERLDRPKSGHSKTVEGTRAINTPTTPIHVDRRFFPRDMRGLLEIYEQGSTLQQDMKTHCASTNDAMKQLAGQCEDTVQMLVTRMELVLKEVKEQVERPANVDWTCVMTALAKIDRLQPAAIGEDVTRRLNEHQEAMRDWESRMEANLTAKIAGMDGLMDQRTLLHQQEMDKLREEVVASQQLATSIGEAVKVTESELKDAFGNQHRALKTDFAQTVQDVLRLLEKNRREDMAKVEPALEEQLMRHLGAHHENLQQSVAQNIEEIMQMQRTHTQNIAGIEPIVKKQLTKQFDRTRELDEPPRFQIREIHKTLHDDVGHLFKEISSIQKAMNLDYAVRARKISTAAIEGKRYREYWSQTEEAATKDGHSQTDDAYMKHQRKKEALAKEKVPLVGVHKQSLTSQKQVAGALPQKKKSGYADHEKKKAKMREDLIKPVYNVANYYHNKGCAQKIARSPLFENFTFFIILLNAAWIAVDADYNDAMVLIDAHPVFQVSENFFCSYFTVELFIRFLAFKRKRNTVRDFWFIFDLLLVLGMIIETWVISLIILLQTGGQGGSAEGMSNFSILRMARMVKILRMARMARLLRMVPELVVIVKSIGAAFRSVWFFLLLTVVILYVYAVGFKQMTKDSSLGKQYFGSVPSAMNSLLTYGMMPIYSTIISDVSNANMLYWPVIFSFILLASLTVMNMLIGVLVEVVRTVAEREREAMTVIHVTNELREVMTVYMMDRDAGRNSFVAQRSSFALNLTSTKTTESLSEKSEKHHADFPDMSKEVFEQFLNFPGVGSLLQDCGVDPVNLLDSMDMIYDEKVATDCVDLRFVDFVDVVLNMRGTNPATVKDVKEQMRIMKLASLDANSKSTALFNTSITKLRNDVMMALADLRRVVDSDYGSDTGENSRFAWAASAEFEGRRIEDDDDEDDDEDSIPERQMSSEGSHRPIPTSSKGTKKDGLQRMETQRFSIMRGASQEDDDDFARLKEQHVPMDRISASMDSESFCHEVSQPFAASSARSASNEEARASENEEDGISDIAITDM